MGLDQKEPLERRRVARKGSEKRRDGAGLPSIP